MILFMIVDILIQVLIAIISLHFHQLAASSVPCLKPVCSTIFPLHVESLFVSLFCAWLRMHGWTKLTSLQSLHIGLH